MTTVEALTAAMAALRTPSPTGAQIKLYALARDTPITARFVEEMTDSDRALAASVMRDMLALA